MIDVSDKNLRCANCNEAITELPFEPKADRAVYCKNCHRERRNQRQPSDDRQRQQYDVTALGIKCAGCGTAITQLPFQPTNDRPIYCGQCLKQKRSNG